MAYINDSFIENVTSLINSTDVPIMVKDTVGVGFFFSFWWVFYCCVLVSWVHVLNVSVENFGRNKVIQGYCLQELA